MLIMELRILNYFLAIVREGSILGAAKSLNMTQPTLSTQVRNLEKVLGKQLFIRGSRRIVLTEEGKLLQKRAEEIIALVAKTKSEIINEPVGGDLYIGVGESQSMEFITKSLRTFKASYPLDRIHLMSGSVPDILEKLDKGLLDFGILINPPELSWYESMKLPDSDVLGLLMRKDSSLAKKDFISPEDLRDIPLLKGRNYSPDYRMSAWLGYDCTTLNIVAECPLIFSAAFMVEEGMGYATSLKGLIPETEAGVLCFRPFKPTLSTETLFVWKKNRPFHSAAEKFVEYIGQKIKKELECLEEGEAL